MKQTLTIWLSCCTIWHEKKNCCLCEGWRVNLNTMIATWKSVVNQEILNLGESFQGICVGQDFSKACQYATMDEKTYKGLKYVFIKFAQND